MNIAPPDTAIGFEVTFDSPSLFVAMRIFDDLGAQVGAPIPMLNVYGNTYRGFFTPSLDTGYLIHKAVYTDESLITLHPDYAPGSETIYAQNGGSGSGSGGSCNSEVDVELDSNEIEVLIEQATSEIDVEIAVDSEVEVELDSNEIEVLIEQVASEIDVEIVCN
jgi:hypothetical protein